MEISDLFLHRKALVNEAHVDRLQKPKSPLLQGGSRIAGQTQLLSLAALHTGPRARFCLTAPLYRSRQPAERK